MSRAFVKESDAPDLPPERPIGPERNFVTAAGLAQIDAELAEAARHVDNPIAARDYRYWSARRASAELVKSSAALDTVAFGHAVSLEYTDGREATYRIVGIDEADPARGLLSYASPLAASLLGKEIGDTVRAGASAAEIVSISAS